MTGYLGPVAAGLLAAAGLLLAPAPATAAEPAGCPGASGVTVVVDFNELPAGEELQAGCDPTPGGAAASNFADAGFRLTQATGDPGFTCQVDGRPADRDCTASDAFWSLWWSDGKSGKWVFATRGVTTLRVPEGGYVAFAWHEGAGTAQAPDARPAPRVPTSTAPPTKSAAPSSAGTTSGTKGSGSTQGGGTKGGPSAPSAGGSVAATPSASSATPSGTASTSPSSRPTTAAPTEASTDPTGSALPDVGEITAGPEQGRGHAEDEGSSLGTWLGVGAGVGVLGAAGAVPLIRRRLG